MKNQKSSRIRVSFKFLKAKAGEFVSRCRSVIKGLTGNPAYPNSPIDPAKVQAALDSFNALQAEALDGSKTAIAARDLQFEVLVRMMRTLGHYVEATAGDDLNMLLTSGFEQLTTTRTAPAILPAPVIASIKHGLSGQLLIAIIAVLKTYSYEVRYAPVAAANAGGPWVSQPIVQTRTATACTGLIPGTAYAFQVRSLGKLGFSDWSDSSVMYCN